MNSLLICGDEITGGGATVGEAEVLVGVGVSVAVGLGGAFHVNVDITCANTADSAALSNSGSGGSELPAAREWRTKSILMQALFLRVE
jgi:hypothetical protein